MAQMHAPQLLPSIERLRELFVYDPETGLLTRKITQQYQQAGTVCNKPGDARGHLAVTIKRRRYYIHRIAWAMYYGEWPDGPIDHINRIPWDNRIANLRLTTNSENQQNRAPYTDSRSGVTGVNFSKGKWRARITVNDKDLYLGRFDNIADAIEARRIAESALHPCAPTDIKLPNIDASPTGAARTYVVRKIRRRTHDEAVRIAAMRLQGVSCKKIAEEFGCSKSYPREIVAGRARPDALSAARNLLRTVGA